MTERKETTSTSKPALRKPAKPTSNDAGTAESTEASVGKNAAFRLDPKADIVGTHLVDRIESQPFVLVTVFGKPQDGDGYKVSGRYVFSNDRGEVFAIYDWKSTNLYFGPGVPSPNEFWDSEDCFDFGIGGKGDPTEFKQWLVKTVNDYFDRRDRLVERMENVLRKKGLDPSILYAT